MFLGLGFESEVCISKSLLMRLFFGEYMDFNTVQLGFFILLFLLLCNEWPSYGFVLYFLFYFPLSKVL